MKSALACHGYHETAWTTISLANILRKHRLPELCVQQLSKTYSVQTMEVADVFSSLFTESGALNTATVPEGTSLVLQVFSADAASTTGFKHHDFSIADHDAMVQAVYTMRRGSADVPRAAAVLIESPVHIISPAISHDLPRSLVI